MARGWGQGMEGTTPHARKGLRVLAPPPPPHTTPVLGWKGPCVLLTRHNQTTGGRLTFKEHTSGHMAPQFRVALSLSLPRQGDTLKASKAAVVSLTAEWVGGECVVQQQQAHSCMGCGHTKKHTRNVEWDHPGVRCGARPWSLQRVVCTHPTIGCGGQCVFVLPVPLRHTSLLLWVALCPTHNTHSFSLASTTTHCMAWWHTPKRMGAWCVRPSVTHHPRGRGGGVYVHVQSIYWVGARMMTPPLACGPSHINIARSCKHGQEGDTGASVKKHCVYM